MKLLKKILFILFMLTLLITNVKAKHIYELAEKKASNYLNDNLNIRDTYSKYIHIVEDRDLFYTKTKPEEDYKYGGLLSYEEFEITKNKKSENSYSYLYEVNEYWTYTSDSENKKKIVSNLPGSLDINQKSNLRVTEYTKPTVSVVGEGTYSDPWVFEPQFTVTLKTNNINKGKLIDPITNEEVSLVTYEMSSNQIRDLKIKPEEGNHYLGNKCGVIINDLNARITTGENANKLIIHKVTRDMECVINFGEKSSRMILHKYPDTTPASHDELFVIPNKGWYEDETSTTAISKLPTNPTLNGYDYKGYYTENNKATGSFAQNCAGTEVISETNVLGSPALQKDGKTIYTDNKTIYPCFIPKTYIVEYKCNKTDEVAVLSEEHIFNVPKMLNSGSGCSKVGYTFDGWLDDDGRYYNVSQTQSEMTYEPKITLYAKWKANNYTVTFNPNGGTTPNPPTKQVTYDSAYNNLASVSRVGYTFNGWYTAAEGGNKITSETIVKITSAQTLYAHWTANTNTKYVVNHYKMTGTNNASASTPFRSDVLYGTSDATFTPSDKKQVPTGYTYKEAKNTSGTTITSATIAPNGTTEVNLYYNQNYVTITYNSNGATTRKFKGTTYDETNFQTQSKQKIYYDNLESDGLPNFHNDGYINLSKTGYQTTGNWYKGSVKHNVTDPITGKSIAEAFGLNINNANAQLTLYAEWKTVNYSIAYNLDGGIQQVGAPTLYNIESPNIQLPTTPTKEKYKFAGWYTNAGKTGSSVKTIPTGSTGNKTFYAKWEEETSLPLFKYTGTYELIKDNGTRIASGTNNELVIPTAYLSYTGNWKLRLLTSGELKFSNIPSDLKVDVFLVGGGGGGAGGIEDNYSGGGGGGGYGNTIRNVTIAKNNPYNIHVGAGGSAYGGAGETTTAFNQSASGGQGGSVLYGGQGGNNGGNGGNGYESGSAGSSGSISTREFGESSGKLYAGGGGGAGGGGLYLGEDGEAGIPYHPGGDGGQGGGGTGGDSLIYNGTPGATNTGGGGGGGTEYYGWGNIGSPGGSGIVIIRNAR